MVTYRTPTPAEAQSFWDMMNALDSETTFMMFEPGERPHALDRVQGLIAAAQDETNFLMCAYDGATPVGFLAAERGMPRRIQHTAYIVTGIRSAFRHQGVGARFFELLDAWAEKHAITRLELTVVADNENAKHLYEKSGFAVEGLRRGSMRIDGVTTDEYYMAKVFPCKACHA